MAVQALVKCGAGALQYGHQVLSVVTKMYGVVGPTTLFEAGSSGIPGSLITSFQLGQHAKAGSQVPSLVSSGTATLLQNTGIALCGVRAAYVFKNHVSQKYVPVVVERDAAILVESPKKEAPQPAPQSKGWFGWSSSSSQPAAAVSASTPSVDAKAVKPSWKTQLAGRVAVVSDKVSGFATFQIAKQALIAGALYNMDRVGSVTCAEFANRTLTWVIAGAMVGTAADVIRLCRTSPRTIGFVPKYDEKKTV